MSIFNLPNEILFSIIMINLDIRDIIKLDTMVGINNQLNNVYQLYNFNNNKFNRYYTKNTSIQKIFRWMIKKNIKFTILILDWITIFDKDIQYYIKINPTMITEIISCVNKPHYKYYKKYARILVDSIFKYCKNLKKLDLGIAFVLNNYILKNLQSHCPNINSIKILYSNIILDIDLNKLMFINHIDINQLLSIQTIKFTNINLKSVFITNCCELNLISLTSDKLEHLVIKYCDKIQQINLLSEKLVTLKIINSDITDTIINNFNCKKLLILELTRTQLLTANALSKFILNLKLLVDINLSYLTINNILICDILNNCTLLKKINFKEINITNTTHICKIQNLSVSEINLLYTTNLTDALIINIISGTPNLINICYNPQDININLYKLLNIQNYKLKINKIPYHLYKDLFD